MTVSLSYLGLKHQYFTGVIFRKNIKRVKKLIRGLFKHLGIHKCNYAKTGFIQAEDRGMMYLIRRYKCCICGREKYVDGRTSNL